MKSSIPVILAVLFAATFDLHAVLMKPLPIEKLSQGADLIVQGTVVGKACQRDEAGRIYTKIEVKIIDVWKGTVPDGTLTIFQGGGTVGNERVAVSGEAEYGIGEEVVAFLVLNPRGLPITFALGQGKFHVWQDEQTREKFAHNLFHGSPEPPPRPSLAAADHATEKSSLRLNLKDLKQRVHGGKQ